MTGIYGFIVISFIHSVAVGRKSETLSNSRNSPSKNETSFFRGNCVTRTKSNNQIRERQINKMSIIAILLILAFLLLSQPLSSSTSVVDERRSAYEVLGDYDFPEGILPQGVTGYDLEPSSGKFNAYLKGSCSFSLEGSYQLKYKSTISGYISNDRITSLTGVSVKVLFFWLNIIEVVRNGDDLEFSVGIASASFPLRNFLECPQCGCGINCNTLEAH